MGKGVLSSLPEEIVMVRGHLYFPHGMCLHVLLPGTKSKAPYSNISLTPPKLATGSFFCPHSQKALWSNLLALLLIGSLAHTCSLSFPLSLSLSLLLPLH